MNEKKDLRLLYLKHRDSLSEADLNEKSEIIIGKLVSLDLYKQADTVLTYLDFRSEVRTTDFVKRVLSGQGKRVFVPKVKGEELEFGEISTLEELEIGYQGLREPIFINSATVDFNNCLCVIPGAVFDKNRGRIGYGKGYYDRFLAKYPLTTKIALCFDCQIAPYVPIDSNDVKPDLIITESIIFN
ncbi:MAG: 5-formyltetrahydrofolate cyclo-ligase [Lachnospiraceae bacterium]|nr:5-formyltetrahydrofolate cyclo-ligase [Lachnospiraceae bacterium]